LKLLAASLFHSWNWSNPTLCLPLSLSVFTALSFSLSSYLSRNPGLVGLSHCHLTFHATQV
jgi:hypothetical protein